ncbi:MAG: hypothetical protein IRY83_11540 [Chloroflexi bacterium]|nr:hypothetical protein [Chloroflexota bacterium]
MKWRRLFGRGGPDEPRESGRPAGLEAAGDRREAVVREAQLSDEDGAWRSLGAAGVREPSWARIVENLNDATEAYRTNPLAFRLIQLQVDHVLGDGMVLRASRPEVQAELERWWNHPLNNMAVRQFDFLTALALDGEIFVTVHTNPYDRMSYCRLVPAALIDRIETNPEDLDDERRFHQLAASVGDAVGPGEPGGGPVGLGGRWWEKGEMFHFAINRPAGVVRGQGDLVPLLPWLRRYRDWLTDRVRLNRYRSAYLWHVTLRGADRRAIVQRRSELSEPPAPGSILVTNESETWEAVQPRIDADSVEADGYALRLMIAAGAGVPLHWLAEAERTARGTAAEMTEPTYRHFRQRQLYFGWAMRTLAVEALRRRGLVDLTLADVRAEFPELDPTRSVEMARAAAQLTDALAAAVDRGWLTNAAAAAALAHVLPTRPTEAAR